MKTKLLKLTAIMLIMAGVVACVEKENQESENTPVEFTEYSLAGTGCQWTNLSHDGKVIIINSKEDLEKYITCAEGDFPEVDFSKNTVLLASGTSSSGVEALYSEWLSTTDKSVLNIEITQNDETVVEGWSIAFVVNQTELKSPIEIEVTILTEEETNIPYLICPYEGGYKDTIQVKHETWLFNDSVSEKFMQSGGVSWIVYRSDNNTAIMYMPSTQGYNIYNICNYPEFAKQWNVPDTGQKVYYEGVAFCTEIGYDKPIYHMVLTKFRKK
jgi:hypothetical protein